MPSQYNNNKGHKVWYDTISWYVSLKFPLKSSKLQDFTIFRSHNNNNNNRLPSKISEWLSNPGGKRLKPIEEISQEELYACFYVFTHFDFRKSSSVKSVRAAAIMFVSVPRHHSAKHLHKCAQLLRFSNKLKV